MRLLVLLIAVLFSGCTLPGIGTDEPPTTTTQPVISPTPQGPPLAFGGFVVDILTQAPIEGALARLDLAQIRPCRVESIVWNAWDANTSREGRFDVQEVPRPRSNDVAFWVHVTADGYAEGVKFIGAAEAREDIGNITFELHPRANVTGHAPAGTLVAIADRDFPRVTISDGKFAFADAHVTPSSFVAATSPPFASEATAPATIDVPEPSGKTWYLEGRLLSESGAPMAGDIVAWNGTQLESVGRSGDNGVFVLPLAAQASALRISARTADGRYGATSPYLLEGPPGVRLSMILRSLC